MEVFGGLTVIVAILIFFLFLSWLILPYVIFSMKGQVERILGILQDMDKRLKSLEERLKKAETPRNGTSD